MKSYPMTGILNITPYAYYYFQGLDTKQAGLPLLPESDFHDPKAYEVYKFAYNLTDEELKYL